jgi:hypothetical protein
MLYEGLSRLLIGPGTGFLERGPRDRFLLTEEQRQGIEACLSSHAPRSMVCLAKSLTSEEPESREDMESAAGWLNGIADDLRKTVTQAAVDDVMATLQVLVHAHIHI